MLARGLNLTRSLSSLSSRAMSSAPLLVSPAELRSLGESKVRVLDASWHMPGSARKASDEFIAKRIPGAQCLDLDLVASEHELGLKHMMPSGKVFADACGMGKWALKPSTKVVVYDSHGIFSAPRALFMLRAFGHDNSSVLDGGLPAWEAAGFPTESGPVKPVDPASYPAPSMDEVIRKYEDMVSNAKLQPTADPTADIVLDARSRGRWLGSDPEPRPGLSSGHMPHSYSLPFNMFLQTHDAPDGSSKYSTFKSPGDLEKELVDAVGPELAEQIKTGKRSVVTSCGSGMTAGVLWLGLKRLEAQKVAIYDESWTGYAMRESSVIQKAT